MKFTDYLSSKSIYESAYDDYNKFMSKDYKKSMHQMSIKLQDIEDTLKKFRQFLKNVDPAVIYKYPGIEEQLGQAMNQFSDVLDYANSVKDDTSLD